MSLITQCPACSTMFRVVPDQLRVSEGWVRCGQCDEVFDANAHLQRLEDVAVQPEPVSPPFDSEPVLAAAPTAPPGPQAYPLPVQPDPADAYDWSAVLEPQGTASPSSESSVPSQSEDMPTPTEDAFFDHAPLDDADGAQGAGLPVDAFLRQNPHAPVVLAPPVESLATAAPADDWLHHMRAASAASGAVPAADGPLTPEAAPLSFMASSPTSAKPWLGNRILLVFCVLLVFLLALQFVWKEKDHLAATTPALRPLLASSCELVGCRLAAPRQIESIAIESSAFTSLKPGVYLLSMTLKNAAAMELAVPSLELTLTDTQDLPLVRRVIHPGEFDGKLHLHSGAELSASLPVSVQAGAVADKIAGYKLLAFYP